MGENDLVDLGKMDGRIRKVKIECPLGIQITKNFVKQILQFPRRQKKESEVIILAEPIQIGQRILKKVNKKIDKARTDKVFFATISDVIKIEKTTEVGTFHVSTKNSKYRITFI
jgi:hypothetical protein